MNGKDAKFSFGLSKGNEPIHQWILPEGQVDETKEKELEVVETPNQDVTAANHETTVTNQDATASNQDTAVANQEISSLNQDTTATGEKRKREDEIEEKQNIIANVFKKMKSDTDCQNGKKYNIVSNLTCTNHFNLVDIALLPEHDHIEIFLQDNWRQNLCKCAKVMLFFACANNINLTSNLVFARL